MKTTLRQLEKSRQEVAEKKLQLVGDGVSFFSLTVQDLDDAEQKIREAIIVLQRAEVALKKLEL